MASCVAMALLAHPLGGGPAGSDWSRCVELEDVMAMYPDRVQALLEAINPDHPGLERVKASLEADEVKEALSRLLDYYKAGPGWPDTTRDAEFVSEPHLTKLLLEDTYTLQGTTGTVPRTEEGGLDWLYRGPNDDRQFARFLNRTYAWRHLLIAYQETGDVRYARYLNEVIRDWILHNTKEPGDIPNNDDPWWILDAGIRMGRVWPQLFHSFLASGGCGDATAVLMLTSMAEHAAYLREHHWIHSNHASMELRGLANVALAFPEFKESSSWLEHALEGMREEMDYQFYPDGVQKELTSHYHRVSLQEFDALAELCARRDHSTGTEIEKGRELAWNYLARTMRPGGGGLLNNDSDLGDNRDRVLQMASRFSREDWRYMATHGAEGNRPEGLPSSVFPWAGQLVSRNGWEREAHWSFFDAGPWGIGHQHNDKLHFSASAHGRDLLVDSGRYAYLGDPFRRDYYRHSRAHNVILIDGKGQANDQLEASTPWTGHDLHATYDFALQSTSPTLFEGATHTRAVLYVRDRYWIIFDRIQGSGPHMVNPLWHFHPDCTVATDGDRVMTNDPGKGNLRIQPVATVDWRVDLVRGQTDPEIQGWYSKEYNSHVPSTCAVYTGTVQDGQVFAWLIVPALGEVPDISVQIHSAADGVMDLGIKEDDQPIRVIVNMDDPGTPVTLPDGTSFRGRCAILGLGPEPLIALDLKDQAQAAILGGEDPLGGGLEL